MAKAVAEWDSLQAAGSNSTSMRQFATLKKIPHQTFQKYATADKSKRQKLGGQVGRRSLVTKSNAEFIIQHSIRHYRANTG